MNIGVSTSCYYPLETEISLKNIGEAGIKTAEIFFNAKCELKQSFVDILLEIKSEYNIEITSIHPTMSLAESFMFFSNYERRFYEGLDDYKRYSEIAAMLGAKYIIMHGGKPNGILNDEEYCERYMMLQGATRQNGINVLQENVVRYRAGDIEFLDSVKSILGKEAMFCMDIKQCIRCGYDPFMLYDSFSDNIKHFHISDHTAACDCMLPGNGGFDFKRFINYTSHNGYNGAYIIEVYKDAYHKYSEIADSYKYLQNINFK